MTKRTSSVLSEQMKAALLDDPGFLRTMLQPVLQEMLESEMTACLGAGRYERGAGRRGYRSGSYPRQLLTRVGLFELRVPQDREGRFSTELFERYGRSEKAFTALLVDAYTQGVATRRMKHLTEELCGHEVSASTVSRTLAKLDSQLTAFAERPLVTESYPYLMLDARYERVREGGTVHSRAVQVALGIDATGQRRILAVELASRESTASWEAFLTKLKERGLHGVQFVVSDAHDGLQRAIGRLLPAATRATLLRTLPAQRPGLPAAQAPGRRADRTEVALRPAQRGRSAARPLLLARTLAVQTPQTL